MSQGSKDNLSQDQSLLTSQKPLNVLEKVLQRKLLARELSEEQRARFERWSPLCGFVITVWHEIHKLSPYDAKLEEANVLRVLYQSSFIIADSIKYNSSAKLESEGHAAFNSLRGLGKEIPGETVKNIECSLKEAYENLLATEREIRAEALWEFLSSAAKTLLESLGEQKLRLDYLWDRREALEKEGVSEADLLFYEILKRRIRRIREIVQYNRKTIPQRQDSSTRHELVVPVFSQGQRIKVAFDGRFSKIHTPKDKLVFVTRMSNVQRLPFEYFTWVPLKSNYRVTHADLKNEPIVLPLIDEQVQEDIYKKLKKSKSPMIHSELYPKNSEGQEEGTSLSTKLFDICNKLVLYILKADSSNESEPVSSYSTVCPETYLPQKATSSNEAESIFKESYIQKICSRLCNESDGAMPALDKLSLDSDDFEQMQSLGNVLRKWFCRKCYTYACGEHLPLEVPIPERIFSLSYEKDTTSVLCPPCGSSCFDSREISSRNSLCDHIWTNEDVYSFQSFWRVFGSNWCDFATIFFGRHTCYECAFFAESTNVARRKATRKNGQRKKNQSKRNPIVAVMNHIHCCHEGEECSSDNCSCKKSNLYCEKYCPCQILTQGNCARKAVYCTCRKGKCLNGQCPCFTENRECDPDTCLCFANCRNPSKQKDNEFTCKNIGIRRKAHKRLVIAPSDTHKGGWGLFTLEPIEKFEFVCEYKGELVSLEELERREKSYERAQRNFLFSRETGKVHIDATRKGGKSRFANEPEKSRSPNCFSQYMRTMGDLHVGIYAARNIQAGEEILFIYECGSEL